MVGWLPLLCLCLPWSSRTSGTRSRCFVADSSELDDVEAFRSSSIHPSTIICLYVFYKRMCMCINIIQVHFFAQVSRVSVYKILNYFIHANSGILVPSTHTHYILLLLVYSMYFNILIFIFMFVFIF